MTTETITEELEVLGKDLEAYEIANQIRPEIPNEPKFIRENRYIVFKISDLQTYLSERHFNEIKELAFMINIKRLRIDKPPLKTVVVEHDWPEYEPTWKAIEARVKGEVK